jgi:hypothetical protein
MRSASVTGRIAVEKDEIIMGINHSSDEGPRPAASEKKPYEKPGFRYEQVFVTSALSCTKTGTEGQCSLGVSKVS